MVKQHSRPEGPSRWRQLAPTLLWRSCHGLLPEESISVPGGTDELGYSAAKDIVHVNDLHATMLRQLGIDHQRLTYRYQGHLINMYGQA